MLGDHEFENFNTLFHPKHIAFIGASENSAFGAMFYLTAFKNSLWSDTFYPVNPNHDKILDWKCYPSVLDIPYEVDTAYISLKTKHISHVVEECVKKNIRWVIIFASGFSETGEPEGKILENELISLIKGTNTRIIGPNCLGPFNAEIGMALTFVSKGGTPGGVSFMSQSGGHLSRLLDIGYRRDIRFRYGVSFGNQIDLNCVDFLKHFRCDSKTNLIVAYLESFGSGKGQEFFQELKKTTKIKPVIIWKGGYTREGSYAAYSHTGALASNQKLWNSMTKQTGVILVKNNDQFWNSIKTFELLFPNRLTKGRRVGIVTPGGGSSVNVTDLFADHQLSIPELTLASQNQLNEILPKENVNMKNPVDLGASGFVIDIFLQCIEIVTRDSNIDIIVIPLWPHHLYSYVFKRMIKIEQKTSKPFVYCLPSIADSYELAQRFKDVKKILHKNRSLYYFSFKDAAESLSMFCNYAEFLKSRAITI